MKIDNTIAAVVTGGASGLGAAAARAFAGEGADLVLVDRDGAAAERVAAGLSRARAVQGDAADPATAAAAGQSQRVGVQVTGRAQAPRVRLWSDPALPEAQALSWLALGRAGAADGAESLLLENLAVSLLARRAGLGGGTLAQRLGLDELSLRREGEAGSAATSLGLTLGKRLTQDLYAVYERGVAGVLGTLRVFYDITERLQLRVEAGDRAGVDLVYSVTRD